MYSTTAYLYQQLTKVLIIETGVGYVTERYMPVYAKKLTVNRGVDNVLLFEFVNQDQKPVNITGSTFLFRLIGQSGNEVLLAKSMVVLSSSLGRVKVTLTKEETSAIESQSASYSIEKTSGALITAVFTDAGAGARGPVDIVNSIFPDFIPSYELTIPTVDVNATIDYNGGAASEYPAWNQTASVNAPTQSNEFYSSNIVSANGTTTVQMNLVNYSGTIKAQAAQDHQSLWYNVTDSTTYTNETATVYLNIVGFHPLLRVAFNNSLWPSGSTSGVAATATATVVDGVVTAITVTSAGSGYIAPARVSIIGDGAGATATSTFSNGSLTGITVTDGGSGYRPVPAGGIAAKVVIDTGRVEDILYR